jgi:uncharacterized repeat protein (TIGR01451 family)
MDINALSHTKGARRTDARRRNAAALSIAALTATTSLLSGAAIASAEEYGTQYFTDLRSDCQLIGAGRSDSGQLGGGNVAEEPNGFFPNEQSQPTPVQYAATLLPGESIAAVAPVTSTFVITTEGRVFGAGRNAYGQLGNGTRTVTSTPTLVQLPVGEKAKTITKNDEGTTTVVVTESGKVFVAGHDSSGQSGDGAPSPLVYDYSSYPYTVTSGGNPVPVQFPLPAGEAARDVTVSRDGANIYVITASGKVFAAGDNAFGQVGNGTLGDQTADWNSDTYPDYNPAQPTPVEVQLPAGETAASVVSSTGVTLIVTVSGKVYAAGRNDKGQLGDGTTVNQSTPVRFQLPAGEVATSAHLLGGWGTYNAVTSYVVTESGKVYGAGDNTFGTLGDGTTAAQSIPVLFQLPAGELAETWYGETTESVPVAYAGYAQSASVWVKTRSGKIFGAGDNTFGQLGDGTTTSASTPVGYQLPSGESAVDFAAGIDVFYTLPYGPNGMVTAALTASGKVYGAGYNFNGELGDGTFVDRATPVRFGLPAGESATQIAVSGAGIKALTATGKVFGAGRNDKGQLGIGSTLPLRDPMTYERLHAGESTPVEFQQPTGHRAMTLFNRQIASQGYGSEFPYPYTFVVSCPRKLSLGDIVFDDVNDNGKRDAGEGALKNLKVRIYKDGAATPVAEDTTDENGAWLFKNLDPGSYVVELVLPAGYRSSTDTTTSGDPSNGVDGDDNGVVSTATTVRSAPVRLSFGAGPTAEVAGRVDDTLDMDSNLTLGFGLHKPGPAPTPTPPPAAKPTPPRVETPPPVVTDPVPLPRAIQGVKRTTLAVTKSANRLRLYGGQNVTFIIDTTNRGRHTARGVEVCDRLPAQLTVIGQANQKTRHRIKMRSGQVCVQVGSLAPGARRTVVLEARVAANTKRGQIVNMAIASADNASTASARVSVMILGPASSVLPAVAG